MTATALPPHQQQCPVCGVIIENNAKVLFSAGPPGTRARLHARVCSFAQNPSCINQDEDLIGNIAEQDYYD